eukprot:SAG11_NODE_37883_length_254_cov_9.980645_1_plen_20_part_10
MQLEQWKNQNRVVLKSAQKD